MHGVTMKFKQVMFIHNVHFSYCRKLTVYCYTWSTKHLVSPVFFVFLPYLVHQKTKFG